MLSFSLRLAVDCRKEFSKTDLYHIDISPATTPVANGKILRIFNAYPLIPRYSCSLESVRGLELGDGQQHAQNRHHHGPD